MSVKRTGQIWMMAGLLLVAGCSGNGDDDGGGRKSGKLFQGQTQGLDKAGHVQSTIEQSADRQRKAIEDQSR